MFTLMMYIIIIIYINIAIHNWTLFQIFKLTTSAEHYTGIISKTVLVRHFLGWG